MRPRLLYPLLALAGALCVLSFAPLEWPIFIVAALAALFWSFHTAPSANIAALRGFAFGLGYFVGERALGLHQHARLRRHAGLDGRRLRARVLAAYLFPALAGWFRAGCLARSHCACLC